MMQGLIWVFLALLYMPSTYAATLSWDDYASVLNEHVEVGEKNGVQLHLVDYQALKNDTRWPAVLKKVADFDAALLNNKNEQLSFWINAYNIMAIDTVIRHWPLESIRDIGSFFSPVWKQPAGIVAGKMRSLHEIEHEILRPMAEPLIHVAIVCASVSCPDLKPEPYRAEHLQSQLQAQVVQFLNRDDKGLRISSDGLHLSKLFDWFKGDFLQGNVLAWLHQYRTDIPENSKIVSYLPYDWHVNAL